MELIYVKALSAAVLFLLTLFATMLPLFMFRRTGFNHRDQFAQSENFPIISFLNCFGGGVFLGTCLLHLFPDVQEQMELVFKNFNVVPNYPVGEFLLGFGFLAILIVEQIVLNCKEHSEEPRASDPVINSDNTETGSLVANQVSPAPNYGTVTEAPPSAQKVVFSSPAPSSLLRSLLLLLALSLHALFEGLAIGLQASAQSELRILVAVAVHKSVIAFTLGLNLAGALAKTSHVIRSGLLFSLTSPLGILLGALVVDFSNKGLAVQVSSGVLQGIAAGTFLYVTLFEVLLRELKDGRDRMVRVACVVLGYSVVSLMLTFLPD